MRVPWWAFAIAMILGVASVALSIREREQYAIRLARWKQYAHSAAVATLRARNSTIVADHERDVAQAHADSAAIIAMVSRTAEEHARAAARRALDALAADSALVSDTAHHAEIKLLSDLLAMDSAHMANTYFSHVADSALIAKQRGSIRARDGVISGLQQELRLARDKPLPKNLVTRFFPFAEGGVGVSSGNGSAGSGVVVAGGVVMRLFGPLAVVGRLQYDGAAKAGSAQALVRFTF